MEREACVCDHGLERSDLCAEIIIIILIKIMMADFCHCSFKLQGGQNAECMCESATATTTSQRLHSVQQN